MCDETLKPNAAKVTSSTAKVTTNAAKVTSESEDLQHNQLNTNDLYTENKSLDNNIDKNGDGKCILSETFSLRSDVSKPGSNLSFGATILNDIINKELSKDRHKLEAHRASNNLNQYKCYRVIDHDKKEFIGYNLPYDFISLDANTGKPYTRSAEIEHYITDIKLLLQIMGFGYTAKDISSLRQLFSNTPLLTYDHINELLSWCQPRVGPMFFCDHRAPGNGHDSEYWSRRVTNLKQLLRYLPQVIKEYFVAGRLWQENDNENEFIYTPIVTRTIHGEAHTTYGSERSITGLNGFYEMPMMDSESANGLQTFDYKEIPEPFLSLAFAGDTITPVTYEEFTVESEVLDEENWLDQFGLKHPKALKEDPERYGPRYKLTYTDEHRPVHYAEFVGAPGKEATQHARNPIPWIDRQMRH